MIFHSTKETVASYLQRWMIILSAYDYVIQYKPSAQLANVDGLSLLPLKTDETNTDKTDHSEKDSEKVCAVEQQQLDCLPIQASDIQKAI